MGGHPWSTRRPGGLGARPSWLWLALPGALLLGLLLRPEVAGQRTEATASTGGALAPSRDGERAAHVTRSPHLVERAARTRRVSGEVRTSSGAALAAATVCGVTREAPSPRACRETDRAGRFTLPDPDAALRALLVSAAGFAAQRAELPEPSADTETRTLIVVLTRGGEQLSGSVLDARGGVVPGALVGARPLAGAALLGSAVANDAGEFTLTLPAGDWELITTADGYASQRTRTRAPARGMQIVLVAAATIGGQVVDGETGAGLADVRVVAGRDGFDELATTVSAEDGSFSLEHVPPAAYDVAVRAPGWESDDVQALVEPGGSVGPLLLRAWRATKLRAVIELEGEPCRGAGVTLASAAETRTSFAPDGVVELEGLRPATYHVTVTCPQTLPYEQELTLGAAPLDARWSVQRGIVLEGKVESPSGEPVPGAQVHLSPASVESRQRAGSCTTGELGELACGGLAAGDYEATVVLGEELASDPVRVTVGERGASSIVLRTRGFGSVRVIVDAPVGAARPFEVVATGVTALPVAAVERGGEHWLEQLPLGRHVVSIDRGGGEAGARAEALLEHHGQTVTVALSLPSGKMIAGRVLDQSNSPVVDALVVARAVSGDPSRVGTSQQTVSDEDGRFWFEALAAGAYDLRATTRWGTAALRSVAAGTEAAQLTLTENARLLGSLRGSSGEPVAQFAIAYQREGGERRVVPGRAGRWDLGWLEPGPYEVTATADAGIATQRIELSAGLEQELDLQLAPQAALER